MVSSERPAKSIGIVPIMGILIPYWSWPVLVVAAVAALVLAPGPVHHAAHATLHGLCAQRPMHSFAFGDRLLPFDARMTGIYGGLAVTLGWMALRGRLRCWEVPTRMVVVVLGGFVGALAVDGFNSLALDLKLDPLYTPTNVVRLLTGLGSGIAMATLLSWLFATSVWSSGYSNPPIRSRRELFELVLLATPLMAIVLTRPEFFYLPITFVLLASAWLTLTMLVLVMFVLLARRDRSFGRAAQLHWPLAGASVVALGVMLALAGGRFWLERALGLGTVM